jgi:molecular chaperone DnaK
MSAVVGIDLGTTNTVVGVVQAGSAITVPNERGERLLPSVVSFHPSGSVLVGRAAKDRRLIDAKNTIYSTKRLLGRAFSSEPVRKACGRAAFELKEGPGQGPLIVARGETYTLPEISAFVVREARRIAQVFLHDNVERAVITVPANFNDLQRAATKVAGRIAGVEVMRILNEPTAAALAYGYGKGSQERVAIYDFGGGTFDVTLLDLAGNVFEVLATAGDTFLGGDDIDAAIAERMAQEYLRAHRYDTKADPQTWEHLLSAAESLKIEVSISWAAATHEFKDIVFGVGGKSLDLRFTLTPQVLTTLLTPLVDRTLTVCAEAMRAAGLKADGFDQVILVGGTTRLPVVRERVGQFFGRRPLDRLNPDEVVALGAAIQAAALTGADRRRAMPERPSPPAPPVATAGGAAGQGTQPSGGEAEARGGFANTQRGLASPPGAESAPQLGPHGTLIRKADPSHAAQIAAAVAAATAASSLMRAKSAVLPEAPASPVLAAKKPGTPLLIDVTPLSLSVETVGGYADVVLERNTPVPCERTRVFATAHDNQVQVHVNVAQGESSRFSDNVLLGQLQLTGLRPAARGETTIAVTFELNTDGMLGVRAVDQSTGKSTVASIKLGGGIPDASQIEAMAERVERRSG